MRPYSPFSSLLAISSLLLVAVSVPPLLAQEESIDSPPAAAATDPAARPEPSRDMDVEPTLPAHQPPQDLSTARAVPNTPAGQPMLLSSSALVGMAVVNSQGERFGSIRELMMNPESGQVAYAVVESDGVLGIGVKTFAIPWDAFKVGLNQTEVVIELRQEALPAPSAMALSQR